MEKILLSVQHVRTVRVVPPTLWGLFWFIFPKKFSQLDSNNINTVMESPPPSQPPGSQKKRPTTSQHKAKIPIQYESEDESGDADVESGDADVEDEVESDEEESNSDVVDESSDEDVDEEFVEIKRQSVRFLRAKLRCKKIQTTGWKKQRLIEKLEEMEQSKFTTTHLPPVPPPEGWFREEIKMPDVKDSRHFGK